MPTIVSSTNPLSLNHSLKYAQELKLLPDNLDEVNLDEVYSFTEEEITSAVNANYPEIDLQSDRSMNPNTFHNQDELVLDEFSLNSEKNSDFFSFPTFPNDPSVDEVNFGELFHLN